MTSNTARSGSTRPYCEDAADTADTCHGSRGMFLAFFYTFYKAKGALQIFLVSTLLAFGVGCVIGLVPELLSDRYARVHYGYDDLLPCSSFDHAHKPTACRQGADEAQAAAASWHVVSKLLSLVGNPVLGSISDVRGRKLILTLGLLVYCLPAGGFLVLLHAPLLHPFWLNLVSSMTGLVDCMSIIFASLSDVLAPEYRTPGYGLLLCAFYGGFAFAPSLGFVLSRTQLAWTSLGLLATAFATALVFMPETLSEQIRSDNLLRQQQQLHPRTHAVTLADGNHHPSSSMSPPGSVPATTVLWHAVTRPFREISILNRDVVLRLVTVGSCISSMVFSADSTLVIYYMQDYLNVRQHDLASLFLVLGIFGILVQAVLLQPLVRWLGDRRLLVVSFLCGALHNMLYGLARDKSMLYAAFVVSQFNKLCIPILSSLASQDATAHEQGRIQGALFATNSLAGSVGPLLLQWIYHHSKDNPHLGPGFMFLCAGALYVVGAGVVSYIPPKENQEDEAVEEMALSTSASATTPLLRERDAVAAAADELISEDVEESLLPHH